MRIAIINSIRAYGGGEKWVMRAAYGLTARGHDVRVLCAPDSDLDKRCRAAGLRHQTLTFRHDFHPTAIRGIANSLRESGAEVAVACNERAGRLAALACRLPGLGDVRLVYRNGLEGSFKNKLYNRLVVGTRARLFVGNAEAVRDEMLGFGWIPRERIRLIYNGVDPAPIDSADPTGVRAELETAGGDTVVLVAARLVPEKGHGFLLRALTGIWDSLANVKIWLAGEGPETERLRILIASAGLGSRTRMLGFRDDIPRLLRAADILCHPSRREGAPNIVLEAMVARLPVVGVDASGTAELVVHEETGLLSGVEDERGLRGHLERLINDPSLRRRLGEAGRKRALTEFTEERSILQWERLLRETQ